MTTKPKKKTTTERLAETYAPAVFSRAELLQRGGSGRDITRAVKTSTLLRLRRDHYAYPDIDERVAEAIRVGGRIGCVTLLEMIGVFVLTSAGLHLHIRPHMSRVRRRRSSTTVMHWSSRVREEGPRHVVSISDAVLQSILCQEPRAVIATLDSVLHLRLATMSQLRDLFAGLPTRLQVILNLLDGSAESGLETYMRLILRALGLRFETQQTLPGVGRVDSIVEGWLIIECDSREFHEGWEKQAEDRRRDIAAAGSGYTTIRPLASDILFDSTSVRQQIEDIIDAFERHARPCGRA